MISIPLTQTTLFLSALAVAFIAMTLYIIYLAVSTPLPDSKSTPKSR